MRSILVVCIGNICRSPMAEELLRGKLPEVAVESAGIAALVGHKADILAQQVIARHTGRSLNEHSARQINRDLCIKSDVILVMDAYQQSFLENAYPQARGKIFRLCERDVPDPYRKSAEAFERVFFMIQGGVDFWSRRIKMVNEKYDVQ